MGAFLDKPKTDKFTESGSGNGIHYGLSSMQGWRTEMEDAHIASTQLPGRLSQWCFFAVFDGHAGSRVASCCSEQLLDTVLEMESFKEGEKSDSLPSIAAVERGFQDAFLAMDEKLRKSCILQRSGSAATSGGGSLEVDHSGSTAVCALVTPDHLFLANCGDSRAVMVRGGKVQLATLDHKPGNPIEKMRIEKAGGSVMSLRVNGSLAVSRALGDFEFKNVENMGPKEQLVSAEPEISVLERDHSMDEVLILACDGIWDVMTNEEASDYVRSRLRVHHDLSSVASELIDTCLLKGSCDNMSVVLVAFEGAPKPNTDVIKRDQELDYKTVKELEEMLGAVASNEFEGNWEWQIDGTQWKQLLNKKIRWIVSTHRAPACVGEGMMEFSIRYIEWYGNKVVLLQACLTEDACNADLNYPLRMWIRGERWDNDEKKYVCARTGGMWFDEASKTRPIAIHIAPNSPPRYRLSFSPA